MGCNGKSSRRIDGSASNDMTTASTSNDNDDGGGGDGLWYVGVILSILGSVCTNVGVNLQKYSFMREAKRSLTTKRPYVQQPLWVIGLLLVIGGSALDFVALSFLPQSLATPVGGSTMVANVVFASLFLKEKFSRRDALGTGLVLTGICIVAAFANKNSACYTVVELVALYAEPPFVGYVVFVTTACLAMYALAKHIERLLTRVGTSSPAYKRFARVHPVTYPALSGIFGAQSVLFAKSSAELIKTTLVGSGENQFTSFGTYAIVLAMFSCVFLQIHWLAHGLQSFDAIFIVPVFQCFFISVSIFGGGVYFKEFAAMSTLSLAMFFSGACVTLSGVFVLSQRVMNQLKPLAKLRAGAHMIVFLKRAQKARHIDYRWVQPTKPELTVQAICSSSASASSPAGPSEHHGVPKHGKGRIVPIDERHTRPAPSSSLVPPMPPLTVQQSQQTTSGDTAITFTTKKLDK